MRRLLVPGALVLGLAGAVQAADEPCMSASSLVHADFPLARAADAIARKQLTIVVLGSASSMLPGSEGAAKAYPARLEEELGRRLPGTSVRVIVHAKPRETAVEMEKSLDKVLADEKPALVIWQTGTADAMLGVDQDEFRSALDNGVEALQAGKADVVLMNMQYSPRTDSMIAMSAYAESMRFVALQREVPLFDRFSVMKQWNEAGVFDLYSATKKIDVAERVHDCIGRLLAGLLVDGAKLAELNNTGSGPAGSVSKDLH
jgi:hypothetical protein